MSEASGPIDVHTHFVPSSIPGYTGPRGDVPWPSIEHGADCCARVMISGAVFRQIESNCWDGDARCRDMEPMGVGVQCLSPMPELMSYWMQADDCAALARHINAELAAAVAGGAGRFRGFGMIPLQDVDLAIRELRHCVEELGLNGVEIGTNVEGRAIGDPAFRPFFAAAEAIGAVVFVHPLRAAGRNQLIGPAALEQIVAFPCETALAIASLITGGTLHRHPELKLVFSHGGGAFAQILPRLQHAWSFLPALQAATGESPSVLARRLHYDSLVYSPVSLKYLIEQFGASQIVIGTDYPFAIMDRTPVTGIRALGLGAAEEAGILHANAERLLGLAA
jgi:aminocarboxymuconate-semialdehyde decarboxylase